MSHEAFTHLTSDFLSRLAPALYSAGFASGGCVAHGRAFVALTKQEEKLDFAPAIHWRVNAGGYSLVAGTGAFPQSESAERKRAYATAAATCLLETYRKYLPELAQFAKGRTIGDRKLYGDTHFRQVVGEMLTRAEETRTALDDAQPDLRLVFSHLGRIAGLATRVLGGRALLRGSVFELQVLCQIFGSTYVD